jgi:hypothetical protein
MMLRSLTFLLVATLAFEGVEAQVVRSGSGSLVDVTAVRDQFRADLGGGTTAGSNGSFGGVRREINWDGVPDSASQPNTFKSDFFNTNSPRGVVFTNGNGSTFGVSAKLDNPTGTPVEFADLGAEFGDLFAAFSAQRLFASFGDPVYDVVFLVPGTNRQAVVSGFGAVFTDVDLPNTSFIEYFDVEGNSLGLFHFPAANGDETFSFLGVSFPGAPQVARVRMSAGNVSLLEGSEPGGQDAAAVDDFLYGEPVEAAGALCVETPTALCLLDNRFRVEVTYNSTGGGSGTAQVQQLSADAGTLTFFRAGNREMLVKMLNGCAVNDHFWFYSAAATDVGFDITVTDTATGVQKTYTKVEGPPAPAITDSSALATCD